MKHLSTIFFILLGTLCQGQSSLNKSSQVQSVMENSNTPCDTCNTFSFTLDAKCKRADVKKFVVDYHKPFRFKIKNVNRYLYDINVSVDDVLYQSEPSKLFKTFFIDGPGIFDTYLNMAESTKANDTTLTDSSFVDKLRSFKQLYDKLLNSKAAAFGLCTTSAEPCCEKDGITFSDYSLKLYDVKIAYAQELADSESKVTASEDEIKSLEEEIAELEKDPKKNKEKIKTKKALLELEKAAKRSANKIKNELTKVGDILTALTDEKLFEQVLFSNNFVRENFEYISPEYYPTGDRFAVTINIKSRLTQEQSLKIGVPYLNDFYNYDFRVRNKWFVSFSTGPFLGIGTQFRPKTYGWRQQPDDAGTITAESPYRLVETGKASMPVGLAAFANIGTKLTDFYGIGGSIGAGLTLEEKPKLAYMAGFTQFFGQDQQFNLTFGVAFMQVEKLAKALYPNIGEQNYPAPANLTYEKKFVNGWFVSLSYTLFKPVKKEKLPAVAADSSASDESATEEESKE